MKPYLLRDGKKLPIVSLWFDDENGEVRHISFRLGNDLRTVFSDDYDFNKVIVWENKEESQI